MFSNLFYVLNHHSVVIIRVLQDFFLFCSEFFFFRRLYKFILFIPTNQLFYDTDAKYLFNI